MPCRTIPNRPLRPWEIQRAAERAKWTAKAMDCAREAAMALPPLSPEDAAERDRLLSLPLGAEGHALLAFILQHQPQVAA